MTCRIWAGCSSGGDGRDVAGAGDLFSASKAFLCTTFASVLAMGTGLRGRPPGPTFLYPSSSTMKKAPKVLGMVTALTAPSSMAFRDPFSLQSRDEWPGLLQVQHRRSAMATGGLGHTLASCSSPQLGHFRGRLWACSRGASRRAAASRRGGTYGFFPFPALWRSNAATRSSTFP